VSLKTIAPLHFEHFFTHADLFVRFSSSKWGLNDPPAPASTENNILTNGRQFAHIFYSLLAPKTTAGYFTAILYCSF